MAGSIFGKQFQISTWGESHGTALGVVVDGCPAGLPLCEEDIQAYLDRRKPGQSAFTTKRQESDRVQILSGIFEGRTTGTPIAMLVMNESHRSADYSEIAGYYRPGHADYTFDAKYGFRDYRGGGRSSGRETIARVAAGAVAIKLLNTLGVDIFAYTAAIGGQSVDPQRFSREEIRNNPLCMPDAECARQTSEYLKKVMTEKDSAGGIVECIVKNLPAGVGDPVFDKLDACLAHAVFSIGAVKGFEIGDGFEAAKAMGSSNNDAFAAGADGSVIKRTNHAGGILGGISDGSDLILRAAFKPTPSIARPQSTVSKDGREITVEIKGRHDPIIVPRAVVVVEAMTALTIADLMLEGMGSRLEDFQTVWKR